MNTNNVPEGWKFPCMCTRPLGAPEAPAVPPVPALLGQQPLLPAAQAGFAAAPLHGKPPAPGTAQPTGGQPRGKVSTSPGFHPPPAPRGSGCTAKSRKLSRALEVRVPAGPTLSLLSAIKKIEGK